MPLDLDSANIKIAHLESELSAAHDNINQLTEEKTTWETTKSLQQEVLWGLNNKLTGAEAESNHLQEQVAQLLASLTEATTAQMEALDRASSSELARSEAEAARDYLSAQYKQLQETVVSAENLLTPDVLQPEMTTLEELPQSLPESADAPEPTVPKRRRRLL